MSSPNAIRVIAICLFRHEGRILVFPGYDTVKQSYYYRPLGGGVEPGETSRETIQREIREELSQEVTDLHLLDVLENLFVFNGRVGHEIVFVYDGAFVDSHIYQQPTLTLMEDNGETNQAMWRALDSFDANHRLVPPALFDLLRALDG